VRRLLHELLSGHVQPTGCAGGAPLTEPTDRLEDIQMSQAIEGSDPTSGAPPPFSLAIEGAASRNYRARISDILDGARSVGRDVDGDPSE